ncbi:MAG: patatin family protein [Propionibacterium sp.]|nr:patatin family protein [Propionibacterium sp.]
MTDPTTAPLTSNVTDVALVFEGGGMRASYTSAVVVALLRAGIHLDYVAGISAGASNTANYLSRDPARARRSFVEFAADPKFGNTRTFLRGQGLFNAEYIYEQTGGPEQALPFDFETFAANPARMRIGTFDIVAGEQRWWSREDITEPADLMRRVRSSSSMPILMPPVSIGEHIYLDGALGPNGGIPLDIARADGFTRFFVVLTRERAYRKRPTRNPWFYRRHFRRYPAVAEGIIERWHRYNTMREQIFDLESSGRAIVFAPEVMPVTNGERNVAKLAASHARGLAQAERELPRWREFLGLA